MTYLYELKCGCLNGKAWMPDLPRFAAIDYWCFAYFFLLWEIIQIDSSSTKFNTYILTRNILLNSQLLTTKKNQTLTKMALLIACFNKSNTFSYMYIFKTSSFCRILIKAHERQRCDNQICYSARVCIISVLIEHSYIYLGVLLGRICNLILIRCENKLVT